MDLDEALRFARDNPQTVLATMRGNGAPQMSPVITAVDDDGHLMISTRETAVKVKNLRRDNRVWLCVLPADFFGKWIFLEGTADIISLPAAMELLVDYYRRISGEHDDWDDYRAAMERDRRVILRVTVSRAGPDISG